MRNRYQGVRYYTQFKMAGMDFKIWFSDMKTSVLSILSLCPGSLGAGFPQESARRLGVWQWNLAAAFGHPGASAVTAVRQDS